MSGFTNPVCFMREQILSRIGRTDRLSRDHAWGFFGVEITIIIIVFAMQTDPFRYFCAILTCTPLGGLAGIAEGMGERIGRGQSLRTIMKTWFYDYGQWLICSIQYFAVLCYLKLIRQMGFHQVWQFLMTMVFNVFSGILLFGFSSACINGRKGFISGIWHAYMRESGRGIENAYFLMFIIMWIVILLLAILGVCCILDHLNSFFRYTLIMGGIWLTLLAVVIIMGYRVMRGIGTRLENDIIGVVWPAFGNPVPLYWLAFLMFLMLVTMTAMKTMNDSEQIKNS